MNISQPIEIGAYTQKGATGENSGHRSRHSQWPEQATAEWDNAVVDGKYENGS